MPKRPAGFTLIELIVVMIVAGSIKKSPIDIVRRTSVPMIAGVIVMFILSMAIFLPMGA